LKEERRTVKKEKKWPARGRGQGELQSAAHKVRQKPEKKQRHISPGIKKKEFWTTARTAGICPKNPPYRRTARTAGGTDFCKRRGRKKIDKKMHAVRKGQPGRWSVKQR